MTTMNRRDHLRLLGRSTAFLTAASTIGIRSPARAEKLTAEEDVKLFMEKYGVPGLSLAYSKNGKIVRQDTYGYANLEKEEKLTGEHQFRIASVSKPITSVAVLKLVEEGKLKLDDRVFGEGGVLGIADEEGKLGGITIHHLLTHTSGGWKNDGDDPMFKHIELGHPGLIPWALENVPLKKAPGEEYAYSNFGYCLLGRVIEKVTGKTYEEYVRGSVLGPAGAEKMRLGTNSSAEKLEGEVEYYMGRKVLDFEMNIRRMDAHGGWMGTPTDVVNFALHVDGFASPADLLKAESIATMTRREGANENYACGWSVNKVGNWWHGGSLPGLTTLLVRTADGYCWAAFANTRASGIGLALDRLMWRIRPA